MSLNPKVMQEALKFTPDKVVTLFDLDLTDLGGPVFYFTPNLLSGGGLLLNEDGSVALNEDGSAIPLEGEGVEFITWRGKQYFPLPIEASGFEMNSSGQLPRPKLTVANVLNLIKPEMITYNNFVGATVTRWRTFAKHLDNGADPDSEVFFPLDVYKIDRKSGENSVMVEFELVTSLDQEGMQLPRRQIIRSACTHRYRVWNEKTGAFDYSRATCPYAGTDYFNANGEPVSTPQEDMPSKQVNTCCKVRFPNQALPTRAFPGVGRFR